MTKKSASHKPKERIRRGRPMGLPMGLPRRRWLPGLSVADDNYPSMMSLNPDVAFNLINMDRLPTYDSRYKLLTLFSSLHPYDSANNMHNFFLTHIHTIPWNPVRRVYPKPKQPDNFARHRCEKMSVLCYQAPC